MTDVQYDSLSLESFPLHTEEARWATHMPAQAEAAHKRGALVCGFTEVTRGHVADQLSQIAGDHGYHLIHGAGDTALTIKRDLKRLHEQGFVHVSGERGYSSVTFEFFGREVTVYEQHWGTNKPAHHDVRVAQNKAIIEAMGKSGKGNSLSFLMGDCNPNGPLKHPDTFPRKELNEGGIVTVYEELGVWPTHIGVNFVGKWGRDKRSKAKSVRVYDNMGSDHYPVHVKYDVQRLQHAA